MSRELRRSVCEYAILVLGLLIFLSGFAHAFLGWPQLSSALAAAGVAPDLRGALAVGWTFGSVAMHTLGLLVVLGFFQLRRGNRFARWVAFLVGLMYLLFGLGAYLGRGMSPHFLAFMLIGALLGAAALLWRADPRG